MTLLFTAEQVAAHSSSQSCWITLHNRQVYDVTEFLDSHPAGPELIMQYAGKDVTVMMEDRLSHVHSESAYDMLNEEMLVGELGTEKEVQAQRDAQPQPPVELTAFRNELPTFTAMTVDTNAQQDFHKHRFLDLTKPLMPQILAAHWTKEFYLDQVNRPRHSVKGAMVYSHPVVDTLFSKILWWAVAMYFPFPYMALRCAFLMVPAAEVYKWFAVGVSIWLLLEYLMHRFLFHMNNSMPNYNQYIFGLHFAMHGVHHFLPMDRNRIAAPWVMVVVTAYLLWKAMVSVGGYGCGNAAMAGGMCGFLAYEEFHISLHTMPEFYQFWSSTAHYLEMKRYHLQHHYKNYELGYGVTQKIWDFVFKTVLDPNDETQVHRNADASKP